MRPTAVYEVNEKGDRQLLVPAPSSGKEGQISDPSMWAYLVLEVTGARLHVGASAEFPIMATAWWVDGEADNAPPTGGKLSPVSLGVKSEYHAYETQTLLQVGTHKMVVRVFPDWPRSMMHFLGEFSFEVEWFEFWVNVCLPPQPTVGNSDVPVEMVRLSFYISSIGEMPREVVVSAGKAFAGSVEVVDGVATILLPLTAYTQYVAGQSLDTTIAEVGGLRSATHNLWYPQIVDGICGSGGGGGKG